MDTNDDIVSLRFSHGNLLESTLLTKRLDSALAESIWDTLPEDMVLELDAEVLELIDLWMHSDTVLQYAKPDAHERMVEDVALLVAEACIAAEICDEEDEAATNEITVFVRDRLQVYFSMGNVPLRSESRTSIMPEPRTSIMPEPRTSTMPESRTSTMPEPRTSIMPEPRTSTMPESNIRENIEYLKTVPQPAQRTREWYEFRHGLMTASNVYKALSGSESQYNSLIYEKCLPPALPTVSLGEDDMDWGNTTNTSSPMHWGQKYEPVTQQLYMKHTNTTIEEFGCIQHRTYPFLGASPDGIVTSTGSATNSVTNSVYGRMVEIKNIVNREITGIPLEAYWVQMQLQMEVCDLDECDFVETRIIEYPDEDAFYKSSHLTRGVILYLLSRTQLGSTPHYVYMPLEIPLDREAIDDWIAHTYEEHAVEYTLFRTLYWYLDEMSVVLVRRNRRWFEAALPVLDRTWRTIEHERIHGYEHRAPKKRESDGSSSAASSSMYSRGVCVIKLDS